MTQLKKEQELDDQERFRQFLQKVPGFEEWHAYSWEELKIFANEFLENSANQGATKELLQVFADLQPKIACLKKT